MTCRLFIDEVGNDDSASPTERFLSLTGITTKKLGHDKHITPEIEGLKADLFGHNPPRKVIILHRREIVRSEPPFKALLNATIHAEWEQRILGLIETLPYIANTVLIDKHEHVRKYKVWRFNPYHYCLTAVVERYVLWLTRNGLTGDVVIEERFKQLDKKLKAAFTYFYENGTWDIKPEVIQRCLTSREIKFESKEANVCGLQLVEMIGHPSHQAMKAVIIGEPMTARFGCRVVDVLVKSRYSRNPKNGVIKGWGQKWLP